MTSRLIIVSGVFLLAYRGRAEAANLLRVPVFSGLGFEEMPVAPPGRRSVAFLGKSDG